jgi:hypothetical protein
MHPGQDFHLLGHRGVPRDRPMMGPVQAHHLGQDMRIPRVRLRPGHPVPLAVTGDLQRVDRKHRIPSRDQRLHPRAAVGLDPHHDIARLILLAEVITDQGMQPLQAKHALGQAPTSQDPTGLIDQLDIMMSFGPVITDEQHHTSRITRRTPA